MTTETSIRPAPGTLLPEAVAREAREQVQRDLDRASDDVSPLVELIAQQILLSPDLDANLLRRHCSPNRRTLEHFREQLGATPWAVVTMYFYDRAHAPRRGHPGEGPDGADNLKAGFWNIAAVSSTSEAAVAAPPSQPINLEATRALRSSQPPSPFR